MTCLSKLEFRIHQIIADSTDEASSCQLDIGYKDLTNEAMPQPRES